MAGGGSIASMIVTLRNNARLLRRKSMFKREPSFLNAKKELFKAAEGKINLRKATPNELKKVRELIARNRRINRRNFIIAFAILIPSVILISKLGLDALNDLKLNPNKFKSETELSDYQKKREAYLYYITDGDRHIKEKQWKNAILQYKAALNLFPDNYEAEYRLILAYSYSCLNSKSNCKIGLETTTKILKNFPENKDLQKLSIIFKENSALTPSQQPLEALPPR